MCHYPRYIGPHCTDTPNTTNTPFQDMKHGTLGAPLLVTSSGHHWRPVQKSSLEDPPLPQLVLTSGAWSQKTYGW